MPSKHFTAPTVSPLSALKCETVGSIKVRLDQDFSIKYSVYRFFLFFVLHIIWCDFFINILKMIMIEIT